MARSTASSGSKRRWEKKSSNKIKLGRAQKKKRAADGGDGG
jgi:hypothetical protein